MRRLGDREAPWPLTGDLMFCDASAERAEALAREYMANYFLSIVGHYELMSVFRAVGMEPALNTYVSIQTWGTPAQILEKLEARKRLLGGVLPEVSAW